MSKQKVKVWCMSKDAVMPVVMTEGSVGFDICASEAYEFSVGDFHIIKTDLVVMPPKGYHIEIALRSSLPKRGLAIPHGLGIVDTDFVGEGDRLGVPIFKFGEGTKIANNYPRGFSVTTKLTETTRIEKGERIAQLVFRKTYKFDLVDCTGEPNESKVRGGFGSTNDGKRTRGPIETP